MGMRLNKLILEAEQILASCDVKQLSQAATATSMLGEIDKKFGPLKRDGRVERARPYVKEQIKKLKLASIEAI